MDDQESLECFLERLLSEKAPVLISEERAVQRAPEAAEMAFHQPQ